MNDIRILNNQMTVCMVSQSVMKLYYFVATFFLILFFLAGPSESSSGGQGQSDFLIVDVSIFPPLVMKNDKGDFYGFDIDLWEAIAKELNLRYRYREAPLINIFLDLRSGMADVGLSGISITSDREEQVDFSTHYFDSGLGIMVRKSKDFDITAALKAIAKNMLKGHMKRHTGQLLQVPLWGLAILYPKRF
jgi:ABC-type amino acid transport substrate-binding protein